MGFLPGDPLRRELEWEAHAFVRVNARRLLVTRVRSRPRAGALDPRSHHPEMEMRGAARFARELARGWGAAGSRPARRSVSRLQVRRSTR